MKSQMMIYKLIRTIYFRFMVAWVPNYRPTEGLFNAVSLSDQFRWLSKMYPNYEDLCFGKGYIGLSYPIDDSVLNNYIRFPNDYGVIEMLQSAGYEISDERTQDILNGNGYTTDELEILVEALSEDDLDGWNSHYGFSVELADKALFAHFLGQSLGQGGIDLEYCGIFASLEVFRDWILDQPMGHVD